MNLLRCTILGLFIFIISFKITAQSLKQSSTIQGIVLDENKNEVPYASASLLNFKDSSLVDGSLADDHGKFKFDIIFEGKYLLRIESIGYSTNIVGPYDVTKEGINSFPTIFLQSDAIKLAEVAVLNTKQLVEKLPNKTVINVEKSVIASSRNAIQLLEIAPGIKINPNGSISLNGKAGVNVFIDGKPVYLSGSQLSDLLMTTIGSSIESIEIYTTPPPGYDASGSGVINIKLKRNKSERFTSEALVNLGYGNYYKSMIGIKIGNKIKNINYFFQYNYTNNKDLFKTTTNRSSEVIEKIYFAQSNRTISKSDNNTFSGGLDYTINDKQSAGINTSGNYNKLKILTGNQTKIGTSYVDTDSTVLGRYSGIIKNLRVNLNGYYRYNIDTLGQTLMSDFGVVYYNNSHNMSYFNHATPIESVNNFKSEFPTILKLGFFKIDYAFRLKSISIISGLKLNAVESSNDFKMYNIYGNKDVLDTANTTQFIYNEKVIAGYTNLKWGKGSMNVEAGIRSEYTSSLANSIDKQIKQARKYINFFPTVLINLNANSKHSLSASFARRIVRPDYISLNPFSFNIDLYTTVRGNVLLRPQYSNSADITYNNKNSFYSSIGVSFIDSPIMDVVLIDTLTSIISQSKQNLRKQKNVSVNVGYPIKVGNWFQSNLDFSTYYNQFYANENQSWIGGVSQISFKVSVVNSIKISPDISGEISYFYQSKELAGPIAYRNYSGLDVGLSYQLRKNLNLRFSTTDIFNRLNYKSFGASESLDFNVNQKFETRVFRIVLDYKIGGRAISASKTRDNSSETNRIK